tara:strand:+ start:160 stop:447 length:288 start_codon:yes stop_codon:yes gene_type:complete
MEKQHLLMPKFISFFLPKRFSAITISKNMALYRSLSDLKNIKLKIHEEVHMDQFDKHGWFKFVLLYVYYSCRHGYWNNPFEIEARKITDDKFNYF